MKSNPEYVIAPRDGDMEEFIKEIVALNNTRVIHVSKFAQQGKTTQIIHITSICSKR